MYPTIYFVIVFIFLLLAFKRPAIAYAFLISTFSIEQFLQTRDVFFLTNGSLVNIINSSVVIFALIIKLLKEKAVLKNLQIEFYLVIFLFIYAFASSTWSLMPIVAYENIILSLPYILITVLLAPFLLNNISDFKFALWGLLIFGSVVVLLLYYFTAWDYRVLNISASFRAVALNPLAIADYAGYISIIAFFIRAERYKTIALLKWLIIPICFIVIVKTGSRGQFIFVLMTLFIMSLYAFKLNKLSAMITIVLSIFIGIGSAYFALTEFKGEDERWETSRIEDDATGRYEAALELIRVWANEPASILFGLGSSASYDPAIYGFYTHVVPLEILGELGLLGFICLILIIYFSFRSVKFSMKYLSSDHVAKSYLIVITGLVLFTFLLSFKQGSFLGSYVLFGFVFALSRFTGNVKKISGLNSFVKTG